MGVGGQCHTPAALHQRNRAGTHFIGGWVVPGDGVDECRKPRPPPGFDARTVQCMASRFINWAIPTHVSGRGECRLICEYSLGRSENRQRSGMFYGPQRNQEPGSCIMRCSCNTGEAKTMSRDQSKWNVDVFTFFMVLPPPPPPGPQH
jgi:hypothetical protein